MGNLDQPRPVDIRTYLNQDLPLHGLESKTAPACLVLPRSIAARRVGSTIRPVTSRPAL
jgi:hypothetical protein